MHPPAVWACPLAVLVFTGSSLHGVWILFFNSLKILIRQIGWGCNQVPGQEAGYPWSISGQKKRLWIAYLEPIPQLVSMPVAVQEDKKVMVAIQQEINQKLARLVLSRHSKPQWWFIPGLFWRLHTFSGLMQHQGWRWKNLLKNPMRQYGAAGVIGQILLPAISWGRCPN